MRPTFRNLDRLEVPRFKLRHTAQFKSLAQNRTIGQQCCLIKVKDFSVFFSFISRALEKLIARGALVSSMCKTSGRASGSV
jgi:hypothetical protein